MAWIYLAESAASPSLSHHGSDQSPTVKTSDTLKEFYCPAWLRAIFQTRLFGTTFEHLAVKFSGVPSISFTADSPARTSALLVLAKAWQASEADWFSRYSASSKKFGQRSSLWKTSQPSEHVARNEWSRNWPASGMTVDGELFPLSTWARRTKETDGFCWPTVKSSDGAKGGPNQRGSKGDLALPAAIHLYPTPSASNYGTNKGGAAGRTGKERPSLETIARHNLWPTPKAAEARQGWRSMNKRGNPTLSNRVGGSLSPLWTEWLQGYPIGWTELSVWAIPLCQRRRAKRLKD
jgi:hypothetical protein